MPFCTGGRENKELMNGFLIYIATDVTTDLSEPAPRLSAPRLDSCTLITATDPFLLIHSPGYPFYHAFYSTFGFYPLQFWTFHAALLPDELSLDILGNLLCLLYRFWVLHEYRFDQIIIQAENEPH